MWQARKNREQQLQNLPQLSQGVQGTYQGRRQGEVSEGARHKRRWGIKFRFNLEYIPEHGGCWERIVEGVPGI